MKLWPLTQDVDYLVLDQVSSCAVLPPRADPDRWRCWRVVARMTNGDSWCIWEGTVHDAADPRWRDEGDTARGVLQRFLNALHSA